MKTLLVGAILTAYSLGQNVDYIDGSESSSENSGFYGNAMQTGSNSNYCPVQNIFTLCHMNHGGPRFMLEASCNPFNPTDPQCFVRMQDDPRRSCYFCCQHESASFQKCSDILSGDVTPAYPNGWMDIPISTTVCYEQGYVNVGEQLYIFRDNGKLVNFQRNVATLDACIDLCNQYEACQWWNYDPAQQACWLKRGQGNPKRQAKFNSMYTGHRDSNELCPDRHLFMPAVYNSGVENSSTRGQTTERNIGRSSNNRGSTGWFNGMFQSNPCPNGRLMENCYNDETCIHCCSGGQAGSDGTPACIH